MTATANTDTLKLLLTYFIATLILVGGFYALVLYPFQLDDLVKGAVIALMTLSANHVFSDSAAARVGRQQETAFRDGLAATPHNGQAP